MPDFFSEIFAALKGYLPGKAEAPASLWLKLRSHARNAAVLVLRRPTNAVVHKSKELDSMFSIGTN